MVARKNLCSPQSYRTHSEQRRPFTFTAGYRTIVRISPTEPSRAQPPQPRRSAGQAPARARVCPSAAGARTALPRRRAAQRCAARVARRLRRVERVLLGRRARLRPPAAQSRNARPGGGTRRHRSGAWHEILAAPYTYTHHPARSAASAARYKRSDFAVLLPLQIMLRPARCCSVAIL